MELGVGRESGKPRTLLPPQDSERTAPWLPFDEVDPFLSGRDNSRARFMQNRGRFRRSGTRSVAVHPLFNTNYITLKTQSPWPAAAKLEENGGR
jgi:hypothetical protein